MTATLTILASFNGTNGNCPHGSLIADAAGNLYGTTNFGGSYRDGTVFEITKTGSGYATTPTTLVSFNGTNGAYPLGSLIADAAGNLYGTNSGGGANSDGTVFEIATMGSEYATTPTTLVSFSGADGKQPRGSLIADAVGNLYGTTNFGGSDGIGTVFEITKTASGYATTPTTLVSGVYDPWGSLVADATGNLYGTAYGGGTVFEIAKPASGHATTGTTLVSFNGTNGQGPQGDLIADAAGNLYGTTTFGGASYGPGIFFNGDGTVFEIAKTGSGYATTPTTLVSFNGTNGANPAGSLIADAAGNLYGTTTSGGAYGDGTVFEIAKTASGYATTPTTLASFNGANGAYPQGSLIADTTGNLYGTTTSGGANGDGAVFEITESGFETTAMLPHVSAATIISQYQSGQLSSIEAVSDTSSNISANLDVLQTIAATGNLSSITMTVSGTPTLTISASQMTADATALGDITNSFMLSITAPSAGGSIPGLTGHANTVVFSGNASQYTITTTGNGSSFTVTEGSTVYTLSNVSALQFSDYTDIVASATPPIAGAVSTAQVTELYGAVLGRTPDVAGLSSYQKYAAANPATSFHQFAEWFLASPEYANNTAHAYAQTVAGDQQFVTDSYNNLLHRNPSSTEVAFYENSVIAPALVGLTPGTAAYAAANTQAHAQVLVYFSQSQEFLNNVTVTTQYSTSATHWLVLI